MKALRVVAFSVVLSLSAVAPAAAQDHPVGQLDMYSARVSSAKAAELSTAGYDITDTKVEADGTVTITIVLSPAERTTLQEEGVPTRAVRDARGQTSRERAWPRRPAATPSTGPGTKRAGSATSCGPSRSSSATS